MNTTFTNLEIFLFFSNLLAFACLLVCFRSLLLITNRQLQLRCLFINFSDNCFHLAKESKEQFLGVLDFHRSDEYNNAASRADIFNLIRDEAENSYNQAKANLDKEVANFQHAIARKGMEPLNQADIMNGSL